MRTHNKSRTRSAENVADRGPLRLAILGTPFVLRAADPEWVQFLRRVWEPFLVTATDDSARSIEITRDEQSWVLSAAGREVDREDNPWLLADQIRHYIVDHALANAEGFVDLHAAFVATDDVALLIAGASGSGKTSLAMALADRGWELSSDDVAPIDIATGLVTPFPKPIAVRNLQMWDALANRWEPPSWAREPRGAILLPASVFSLARVPARPTHLVFCNYQRKEQPALRRITTADAIARCGQYVRRLDAGRMRVLSDLCRKVRASEVTFPSPLAGVELVNDWLLSDAA